MKNFLVKNKYLVALLSLGVISLCVSYFYIGYHPALQKDSQEYFQAARFLEGNPVAGIRQLNRVLTTPLFLYSSIAVNYVVHDFATSFAIINIIFYFLCIIVFYYLALEIYQEKKVAFLSSLLVVCNYYVIDPGNSHLADLGGWFFFLLATLLAVKYFKTSNRKLYYVSILTSAIGVFFKEYGGLALVSLVLLICIMDVPWKKKIQDILLACLLLLAPLICFHGYIYATYHYWYFTRYATVGQSAVTETPKTFILLIKIIGWLFSFGWLAFLYGAWQEWKIKDMRRIKILLALLPVTLTFYIWPAITERLGVMFMMWLALIAGFGLSKMKWYVLYAFLIVYIWFNYNILFLIAQINLPF